MSIIGNRHSITKFIAGESKPQNGQRLAKVGYKTTAKQVAKFPSICVSVPHPDVQEIKENVDSLIPYIGQLVMDTQDAIIRSLYESSDGALSGVNDSDISISQVIAYLSAEQAGGRLTAEYLNDWFTANVQDNLFVVIATKLGFHDITEANSPVIEKHVKVYRELIKSLSGGKTLLTPQQIGGIRRALEVSSVDDETSVKLEARLKQMENKPKLSDMLEL